MAPIGQIHQQMRNRAGVRRANRPAASTRSSGTRLTRWSRSRAEKQELSSSRCGAAELPAQLKR